MTKYRITYIANNLNPQDIEADGYEDNGDWIDFIQRPSRVTDPNKQVLRVRAKDVKRIDIAED